MGIVWIASYPKSGNTWVRFLLYAAIHGPPARSLDIARKIPDIHRPLPLDPPEDGRLLCKTHFACSPDHPRIEQTQRAIVIVRDPRDVLFSTLNYRRLGGLTRAQMSDELFAQRFIASRGDPEFKAQGFGTWASNPDSWIRNARFPVHLLKYESLKADPRAALHDLDAFLGLGLSEQAAQAAIKASSFDAMRAMEIREKHEGARASSPTGSARPQSLFVGTHAARQSRTFFMNKGESGRSLASISPRIERDFNAAFESDMRALGYQP